MLALRVCIQWLITKMLLLHMSLAFTVDEGHQFRHRISWVGTDRMDSGDWSLRSQPCSFHFARGSSSILAKPAKPLYRWLVFICGMENQICFKTRDSGNTLNICLPAIFHTHHHLPEWPIHSIKWPKIGTPKRQKIDTIHLAEVVLRHWPLLDYTTIL